VRGWPVAWLLSLAALFIAFESVASPESAAGTRSGEPTSIAPTANTRSGDPAPIAAGPRSADPSPVASTTGTRSSGPTVAVTEPDSSPFELTLLRPGSSDATAASVTNGSLDSRFEDFDRYKPTTSSETFWIRLRARTSFNPDGKVPVLIARGGWYEQIEAFRADSPTSSPAAILDPTATGSAAAVPGGAAGPSHQPLQHVIDLPEFGGAHNSVFILPAGLTAGQSLYARVYVKEDGKESLRFSVGTLGPALARAAGHARMIALAIGALTSMSLGSLLIWFILKDRLFLLYPGIFLLEAVYLAYFSGEGFEWPLLSYARPIAAYTWNVPVALSGGVACLFIREIADLRHSSPRVYKIFGGLAWAFAILACANLLNLIGWGGFVADLGNLLFLGSAIFTLIVAFLAWRKGNRAAGWFLIAWIMLETVTIATAIRLLLSRAEQAEHLLYYVLPLSMMAAAILVALGVADRLREQRRALSDAERRAQTDPLTGVLNRRSLIERLEAACLRARARGLPIALLFIDLDHFKEINDSYGHAAGDACLRAIIEPIHAELRQSDVIGRYGGEEFVVILSSADMAAAHPIAERIRNRVADVRVEGYGPPIKLTCSIGVASSDTLGVWGEHLIAQADAAVYAAKRSGRNRVQMAIAAAA
jgi:diguanylate cyclase (GGDEF)-like protein